MAAATLDDVDTHLRAIISNLYNLIVQAHNYQPPSQPRAFTAEVYATSLNIFWPERKSNKLPRKELINNLVSLTKTSRRLPTHIPIELIEYVESTRNPDIYTREFVELVMKYNQQQKGRMEAFASFRDILAEQMMVGIPEIKDDVRRVANASGGNVA
ncbi:RNA polymerase II mediator complex subunit [Saxophila tyrrhenica]|uniref:Mediator of RNA polymerase II transcription subunit 10 n=1 Tax=Saxophila tyrrhenica TaxID=1690608 RepID=A0AAV9PNF0_9PEZI|nr:RNA polymerase II mediator complex subunit [Saxophila tyrrhenica]